jgi:hypothetical protein
MPEEPLTPSEAGQTASYLQRVVAGDTPTPIQSLRDMLLLTSPEEHEQMTRPRRYPIRKDEALARMEGQKIGLSTLP